MNTVENKQINLSNLAWYILQRWRSILVLILAGMVVIGLWGSLRSQRSTSAASQDSASAVSKISTERRNYVEYCAKLYQKDSALLKEHTAYMDSLAFMRLDPYHTATTSVTFYVERENESELDHDLFAIVNAYVAAFRDEQNITELVHIASNTDEEEELRSEGMFFYDVNDAEKGLFTIRVYVESIEQGQILEVAIINRVNQCIADISKEFGTHQLDIIGAKTEYGYADELRDAQIELYTDEGNLAIEIDKIKNLITDSNEKQYFNDLLKGIEGTQNAGTAVSENSSVTTGFRWNKRYILAGAFAGLVVGIFLYGLRYLFRDRLRRSEDMEKMYHLNVWGIFQGDSAFYRRRHLRLDQWIRRKRNSHPYPVSNSERVNYLIANLESLVEKNRWKRLCIVYDQLEDITVLQELKDQCAGKGFELLLADQVLLDPQAISCVVQADGVLVAAQIDVSSYHLIEKECKLIEEYNKMILGAVVLA